MKDADLRIYNRALSENEVMMLYKDSESYDCPDSDGDGIPNILDNCLNTPLNSYVDKNGCPIDLNSYYTKNQLEQAIADAITEKNQVIIQNENMITELNSKINSMFTEEQLNNAIVQAIMEKQEKIDKLETQISQMYSQNQLDEAIKNAKKGLYNQEQIEVIINKILEWDTNNDGVIGFIEAIHALQLSTGVKPLP